MKTKKRTCLNPNCQKCFDAPIKELKRGNGKYCSVNCANRHRGVLMKEKYKKINTPNVECAYCKKLFYKCESNKKNSKSGIFFCCRKHKDYAQKIGGIKEIMPPHYGTATKTYRQIAIEKLEHRCSMCGYDKYLTILEAHHIDRNKDNKDISNLQFLCRNCHAEEHIKANDGFFRFINIKKM